MQTHCGEGNHSCLPLKLLDYKKMIKPHIWAVVKLH